MKKITGLIAVFLTVLTAAALVSCGYGNPDPYKDGAINIGAMNGPTMIGLAKLDRDALSGQTENTYKITKETTPGAIAAGLSNRSYDAAALPCNNAAILFNNGDMEDIQIAAVNTLNVLYLVAKKDIHIDSLSDLSGKTVHASGKDAVPQFVFEYLLKENGVKNTRVEYYSEPTYIVSGFKTNIDIAILPQPAAATAIMSGGGAIEIKLDLAKEWKKIPGNESGEIITGVLAVRKAYLKNNKETFNKFLNDYKASIEYMADAENLDSAAQYTVDLNIIPSLQIAKAALPVCGLAYSDGNEMKDKVGAFLGILYGQNKDSVGGKVPGGGFYYVK